MAIISILTSHRPVFRNYSALVPILYFTLFFVLFTVGLALQSCSSNNNNSDEITGFVRSGDQPVQIAGVTILSTGTQSGIEVLGTATTDLDGFFVISYDAPSDQNAVLYLTADMLINNADQQTRGSSASPIRLATVLGTQPVPFEVVINERTTVAMAYTLAQFFTPDGVDGTYPGLQNGAAIAENLVDLTSGDISSFLNTFPNGGNTSTRATFNSLSNMLVSCVRSQADCDALFDLTTPPGGATPDNTLQSAVNIVHFPWQNVSQLFDLSQQDVVYTPALTSDENLTAWTLALVYIGDTGLLNGPGNIAFDSDGNAWVCNNYVFQLSPVDPAGTVCGDDRLFRFTPTGRDFPDSPYTGGGLYGAGYGITLDPDGNVWVGNFGFQGTNCPFDLEELSQTVSKFASDGTPISPNSQGNESGLDHGGFQGAGNTIRQPQGTVSDKEGNIWIANCSGDSITQFPGGNPALAFNVEPVDDMDASILVKPFDIAIDVDGNAWAAGNASNSVVALDTDGNLIYSLTGTEASDAGIFQPMGVASDKFGNVWVANSGVVTAPCDGTPVPTLIEVIKLTESPDFLFRDQSVTMIGPDGVPVGPFKGGGLLIPWGISVDGDGNVWVANFQGNRVSQLCGADTSKCPPGLETGDPITPEGGYFFNGLTRNTAVEIDPSGNLWLTNNWEDFPVPQNPGGNALVMFIGLAAPVQTPLIGPPQ